MIILFFIGISLLYNVVLVSVVQHHESTISIPISSPSWASLPLSQFHPLGHHRALSWTPCAVQGNRFPLSISHMVVCMCQCYSLSLSLPPSPAALKNLFSTSVPLSSSRFISTIFLDSIYMHWYENFIFLFMAYFTPNNRF